MRRPQAQSANITRVVASIPRVDCSHDQQRQAISMPVSTQQNPLDLEYLVARCNEVFHLFSEFYGQSRCQRCQAAAVDGVLCGEADMVNFIPVGHAVKG